MINISGHYREERKITGYCDNDVPLMVNCCGKQIFQTQDYFCNRKDGRLDYQIIYIQMKNPKSIGYISPAINARIF